MDRFFKEKKVLITGSSGFIGSNLYEYLKNQGLNVVGTYHTHKKSELIKCDLTDYNQVDEIMKDIDYVFMIAAKTYGAGTLKSNPASMVKDTITMDANILEAAYKYKVKKVLFLSSSVVYQPSYNQLSEEDLDWNKNPANCYLGVGWIKRYIEKLCEFYSQLGLSVDIVRPANVYGPKDKYEEGKSHVVPALIKRALEKQNPYIVWGDGNAVKDFVYIDDFIRDMLKIFVSNKGGIYNLCSKNLITIKELVNVILNKTNYNITPIYDITKPNSIPFKSLSRNKFDAIFGKEEYKSIEYGIENVVNWLKQELNEK